MSRRVRNIGSGAVQTAREHRADSTPAEAVLWQHLRDRQVEGRKFRRQQAMGPYILDFVCAEARLVAELDGIHHSDVPEQADYDRSRTSQLEAFGYRVIRFPNERVTTDLKSVLEEISLNLRKRTDASPSPRIGNGPG